MQLVLRWGNYCNQMVLNQSICCRRVQPPGNVYQGSPEAVKQWLRGTSWHHTGIKATENQHGHCRIAHHQAKKAECAARDHKFMPTVCRQEGTHQFPSRSICYKRQLQNFMLVDQIFYSTEKENMMPTLELENGIGLGSQGPEIVSTGSTWGLQRAELVQFTSMCKGR